MCHSDDSTPAAARAAIQAYLASITDCDPAVEFREKVVRVSLVPVALALALDAIHMARSCNTDVESILMHVLRDQLKLWENTQTDRKIMAQ